MKRDVCGEFVRLHYNPFQIFKVSKTPAGLYARHKWLDESGTVQWQNDFHETLHTLMSGQSDDGSWNQSLFETIRCLSGLHLTRRNKTEEIEKALDWLMKHTLNHNISSLGAPIAPASPDAFAGLPFVPGQTHVSIICMTLFLAKVFQKGHEPNVLDHYHLLSLWVSQNASVMDRGSDKNNALRALVVHPDYAADRVTATLVNNLDQIREPSGCCHDSIPFFRTINALAHLNLEQANRQWDKAPAILCPHKTAMGPGGVKTGNGISFLSSMPSKTKDAYEYTLRL